MPVADLVEGVAGAFDAVREEFWGPNAKLVFLRREGSAVAFTVLRTLPASWRAEEPTGQNLPFQVADITAETSEAIRSTTHVMVIDSDLPGMNNVVCEIRGATTPPVGTRPWWQIQTRNIGRLFKPPAGES